MSQRKSWTVQITYHFTCTAPRGHQQSCCSVFTEEVNLQATHRMKQVRWLSSERPQCSACRIHSHGGAMYMLFLRIRGATGWVDLQNWHFLQILRQLKNSFQNPRTKHHLCAKFDVLRPSQSRDSAWSKSHSPRDPAYFAIHELHKNSSTM